MEKPSVKTHQLSLLQTHTRTHTHTHIHLSADFKETAAVSFPLFIQDPPWSTPSTTSLCGKAYAAALHADFQAIRGLAAGIHDATVHVTGAVAVVAQVVGAAAAAAGLRRACAARGLSHHHVAKRQELAEKARQDAVNAAIWVQIKPASVTSCEVT